VVVARPGEARPGEARPGEARPNEARPRVVFESEAERSDMGPNISLYDTPFHPRRRDLPPVNNIAPDGASASNPICSGVARAASFVGLWLVPGAGLAQEPDMGSES
jgi:hypothetical protein